MSKSQATGPLYVRVVVVSCSCGMFPLDKAMHRNSQEAWQAAADHVSLNPSLCRPSMNADHVPAYLAPHARYI